MFKVPYFSECFKGLRYVLWIIITHQVVWASTSGEMGFRLVNHSRGCTRHRKKKRICVKFALCKYVANMNFTKLYTQCKCGNGKFAIATFALVAKLCKFHICSRFAPGKFWANSIFIYCFRSLVLRGQKQDKRARLRQPSTPKCAEWIRVFTSSQSIRE